MPLGHYHTGHYIRSLPVKGPPNNSRVGSPYNKNSKLYFLVGQTMLYSPGRSCLPQDHFDTNFYGLAAQKAFLEASTSEFTYLLPWLSQGQKETWLEFL